MFIHLGVSGLTTSVCLEECAYNNMTFRVPDEAGFQPLNECITTACRFEAVLRSDLPLGAISSQICALEDSTETSISSSSIALSSDPGRYLCNYIYYQSLQYYEKYQVPKQCVFIHVPPVEAMPLENQIHIVSQCVRLIKESCI